MRYLIQSISGSCLAVALCAAAQAQDAMFVDSLGDVGVGTNVPTASLHVFRADGTAKLLVEETNATTTLRNMFELRNNGGSTFALTDTSGLGSWSFSNNAGNFVINKPGAIKLTVTAGSFGNSFRVQNNATSVELMKVTADGDGRFAGDVFANGVQLSSSQALKTDFAEVDEATLLAKVAALDISQWRYKSEPATEQHIGPMAEQFQAVFGLGDGKHLEVVDTTGIAFAAIQALARENAELRRRVAALEAKLE